MGEGDAALVAVESAMADTESAGDNRDVLAEVLLARWEITNNDEDFHRARTSLEALPPEDVWQELAGLLIDHGDYDDAETLLLPAIARRDVTARLMTVDVRLRLGNTSAARDALSTIEATKVEPRLKFPYAYTVGLVAVATDDPELQHSAVGLLREFAAFDNPVFRPATDLFAALDQSPPGDRPIGERLRGLLPFFKAR
jgi:hypothetical protein